jgi:hypothetical protein
LGTLFKTVKHFLRSLEGRDDLTDADCWRLERLIENFGYAECFEATGHLVMWPSNETIGRVLRRIEERELQYVFRKWDAVGVLALLWADSKGQHRFFEFHGPGFAEAARARKEDAAHCTLEPTSQGAISPPARVQSSRQSRVHSSAPHLEEEEDSVEKTPLKKRDGGFLKNGSGERQSRAASRRAGEAGLYPDPVWKQRVKQRWEQKVSTEIIQRHGAEKGMALINAYIRGEPEGKRAFNLTDQQMRQNQPKPGRKP